MARWPKNFYGGQVVLENSFYSGKKLLPFRFTIPTKLSIRRSQAPPIRSASRPLSKTQPYQIDKSTFYPKNSLISILYRYRGVNLCQLTIPAPSRRHPFTILFPYFSFTSSPIPAATKRAVARHSFVPFVSLWSNILRSPNSVVNKFQARLGSAKAAVKDDATSDSQ